MTTSAVTYGPGPAILSAEAILGFDAEALNTLYSSLGWDMLGHSSVEFIVAMLQRFDIGNNPGLLVTVERMAHERISNTAKMISSHVNLDCGTVERYGKQFVTESIIKPLRSGDAAVITGPAADDERECIVGISIANLVLIGIEVNVQHHNGKHDATPERLIHGYRASLAAGYQQL